MAVFQDKQYRWTYQFFDHDLILVPSVKPKVFAKFQEYSGLNEDAARKALGRGSHPVVRVVNLPGLLGWTPPDGTEINLDKTFLQEIEIVLSRNKVPGGRVHSPSELETDILWILESTVLHEMVHFFRLRINEQATINVVSNSGRGVEEKVARQFEAEAYAHRPGLPRKHIFMKWMPRTFLNSYGLLVNDRD